MVLWQPKQKPQPKKRNQKPPAQPRQAKLADRSEGSLLQVPAAFGRRAGSSAPSITGASQNGDLRVRIRHRELVQDITGSVNFAVQALAINPGLVTLFPWMSTIAALFESYLFNSLRFQYRTSGSSAQAGKVFYAVDWDVLDAAPDSKVQLLQNRTKADAQTWIDFDLNCDKQDMLKFGAQRYVRQGAAPAGTDQKTYDIGQLLVASQGVTNTPVVGELWVEYDCELITPAQAPQASSSGRIASGGTVSTTAFFGTAPTTAGVLAITSAAAGMAVSIPLPGQYLVELVLNGTALLPATAVGTSAAIAFQETPAGIGGGSTKLVQSFMITTSAINALLTFTDGGSGSVTSSSCRVSPYVAAQN